MYGKQIVNHIGAIGSKVRNYWELGRASRAAKTIDSLDPASMVLSEGLADDQLVPAGAGNICTNCGGRLDGPYCAACGQRDRDMQRPVWYLFADVGDEIFSWDSRVFQTLGPLLFLPGTLTRSFWDGKRARHVPPIRLYLFCSIFFFLVVSVANVAILKFELVPLSGEQVDQAEIVAARISAAEKLRAAGLPVPPELESPAREGDPADNPEASEDAGEAGGGFQVSTDDDEGDFGFEVNMFVPIEEPTGDDVAPTGVFDEAYKELDEQKADATEEEGMLLAFAERVMHGFERAAQDPGRLNGALNNWIPLTMIVLLPVFAIILRGFYWGKNHRLMKQLVFSLHFHSYIFLILALLIIAQRVWGTAASSWMFFAAVPLYLFLGLRTASQQGWIRTSFKFLMISLIYMILMTITVTSAVLLSLSEI